MTMDALLRVTGPATEGNSVPAEVLVRAHPLPGCAAEFEPVDLSPVRLTDIEAEGGMLLLDPSLLITPQLDPDEQQHFVARIDELGLTLGGRTRDALFQDLAEQLSFVWREYALADDDELTEDAQELRKKLLGRVREGKTKLRDKEGAPRPFTRARGIAPSPIR